MRTSIVNFTIKRLECLFFTAVLQKPIISPSLFPHDQADEEMDRLLSEHVMAQHAVRGQRSTVAYRDAVSQLLSGEGMGCG